MGNFIKQFFDIKFWKFILVGILNTVVGMGLQFLFFNLCGWNEWVSSLIGYILGSILSYFLNKYFTFKNKDKGWKPIVKFALNIAICYGLAYGIDIFISLFGPTTVTFSTQANCPGCERFFLFVRVAPLPKRASRVSFVT